VNPGEAYLDHYERFMKSQPDRAWAFEADGPTIQVLAYDGIFEGCRVFATLGLSLFRERLGNIVEVVSVVDDGFAELPRLLAETCLYLAAHGKGFDCGHALSGIENIDATFVRTFRKSALYISKPQGFPPEFDVVCATPEHGVVRAATFISAEEFKALSDLGMDAFESALVQQKVDPFAVGRSTARFDKA
jgi:hypothetical protein